MDEKKKLMVLGAMGVVLLGIGVMQFTKASAQNPAPAPQPTTTASAKDSSATDSNGQTGDQSAPQQNNLVTGAYAYRDPFKPLVDANAPAPNLQNTTPNTRPVQVARNETIPPFPGISGTLPPAEGKTVPLKPPAPEFGYKLAGVIMGRKPAAVFVDVQGVQHLVQLGGSLDGDTQLVNLDRDHVVLRFKDQIKNLTLGGGDSSAK